jgi:hypothetical protein
LSIAEDGEFEVAEALGVGDCFDFDDLSVCDGEAKHHEEASAWGYDDSDFAIYESRLGCACTAFDSTIGYGCCAADLGRYAPGHGGGIGAEYDVGVKDCEKGLEVTATGGGEEGIDDLSLAGEVGVVRCWRSLDPAAGAAGKLSGGSGRAIDDGCDLVEGQVEHVVEHKGEAFGASQSFEDDEESEAD